MEILVGFTCLSILSVALIVKVMLWVTDTSATGAITQHFQAAEYILEHHQPPPKWYKTIRKSSKFKLKRESEFVALHENPFLERLDNLILFFEHCPFFQTEDARTALLEQLNDERMRWIQQHQ